MKCPLRTGPLLGPNDVVWRLMTCNADFSRFKFGNIKYKSPITHDFMAKWASILRISDFKTGKVSDPKLVMRKTGTMELPDARTIADKTPGHARTPRMTSALT
jgi:hypothetical protein